MLREHIGKWSRMYFAIGQLWQKPYFEWSESQTSDINSPINALGREMAFDVRDARICYYAIYPDEQPDSCPLCGQKLVPYDYSYNLLRETHVCSDCCIAIG